jgi:predicted kinase
MLVVVVSGPVASGKSTLSRAVAARLRETEGVDGATIDLDLVYEMLDPRGAPKSEPFLWSAARRVAGRLATALLAEGRPVIAEGDFAGEDALAEFVAELPRGVQPQLVLLDLDFSTAFERAAGDPTRALSKDADFLARNYREFTSGWDRRDVLRLHTGRLTVDEAASAVLGRLATAPST